jgi:sarcosine oxidase subunit gamma
MADPRPQRRSPLDHRPPVAGEGGALTIVEQPFVDKLILRCAPDMAAGPVREILGLDLPGALASTRSDKAAALWLGPDEWMLIAADGDRSLSAVLVDALHGAHHQLVDVGDYYAVIEARGRRAREALMKLSTLDLHSRAFGVGAVAGSVFGRANALLWLREDTSGTPAFWLFIRWSIADYLWCLLADAGREWGVPQQVPRGGERLALP